MEGALRVSNWRKIRFVHAIIWPLTLTLFQNIININMEHYMTNWWAKVNNNIRHRPEYEALFYALFGSYNQDQDFNKTIFDIFLHLRSVIPSLCSSFFHFTESTIPGNAMYSPSTWVLTVIVHQKKKTSTKAVKLFVAFFLTADKLKILQGVMEEDWPVTVNC